MVTKANFLSCVTLTSDTLRLEIAVCGVWWCNGSMPKGREFDSTWIPWAMNQTTVA